MLNTESFELFTWSLQCNISEAFFTGAVWSRSTGHGIGVLVLDETRLLKIIPYKIIIIIIIIKICSAHISTLLGAQGAETEKTWIQTIYNDSKNNIMCRDTYTMQLQIYIIFEKLWHKMSFKQRLKSGFTMTRFEFSWKMIPESRSRDRKRSITPGPFWSWFLKEWHVAGAQIAWWSVNFKQFRNINWSNVIKRFVNN